MSHNGARPSDPSSPPESRRGARRPRPGPAAPADGGDGGGRGDHEARLAAVEQELQEARGLLERIVEQQAKIIETLGAEPQPLLNKPGSGLLGVVSALHGEREEWQRARLRFWRVVGGASALIGLASAIGPRIASLFK